LKPATHPGIGKILCVHQGAELYGSDRSFVACVAALRDRFPTAEIIVRLPVDGPLRERLLRHANRCEIAPIWVLRKTDLMKSLTFGLPLLIKGIRSALKELRFYDFVYVNTVVLTPYYMSAAISRRPLVVHVRELPEGRASKVIRTLLRASGADLFFNSRATAAAFDAPPARVSHVVPNGVPAPVSTTSPPPGPPLEVLCVGRLNAWKGQDVLLDAVAAIVARRGPIVHLTLIGDVFGQQNFRRDLEALAADTRIGDLVTFTGFVPDPTPYYEAANIVVVPSKSPEPFGRVAIEAMAHARPVIASNHGGLTEIVADGETGLLVPPDDSCALSTALETLVDDPALRTSLGERGRARFEECFSEATMRKNFRVGVDRVLARRAGDEFRV